ncbi:MAG: hypothetical protein LBJ72_08275 [Dysgonamonadaceae bacterium]|nr:hypothetical protein [Dysgonamonadaceae bacterium]
MRSTKDLNHNKAEQWWRKTDFRQMENITGYRQFEFDPEDGYQAFVDACNNYWNSLSRDGKTCIWEKFAGTVNN